MWEDVWIEMVRCGRRVRKMFELLQVIERYIGETLMFNTFLKIRYKKKKRRRKKKKISIKEFQEKKA